MRIAAQGLGEILGGAGDARPSGPEPWTVSALHALSPRRAAAHS